MDKYKAKEYLSSRKNIINEDFVKILGVQYYVRVLTLFPVSLSQTVTVSPGLRKAITSISNLSPSWWRTRRFVCKSLASIPMFRWITEPQRKMRLFLSGWSLHWTLLGSFATASVRLVLPDEPESLTCDWGEGRRGRRPVSALGAHPRWRHPEMSRCHVQWFVGQGSRKIWLRSTSVAWDFLEETLTHSQLTEVTYMTN